MTPTPSINETAEPKQVGVFNRYRLRLARDGLSSLTAEFIDKKTESEFQRYLIDYHLPKERAIDFAGVVLYFAYGFLDILTVTENLSAILMLRWGVFVPIAAILVSLTFLDRFKPLFGLITASVMFLFANLIVAMIIVMQPVGAPPYMIGVFFVFIFCSCIQRMQFRIALSVFVLTAINYVSLVLIDGKIPPTEIISGIAFMLSFTVIAAGTNYLQELEARQIWRRDKQKKMDAAHIQDLLIEATAADQSKNNFLTILSHELRTPLHQIIGFAEIVKKNAAINEIEDVPDFLEQIHGSAHELLGRIGKMLRYADATAGKIQYDLETCGSRDLVDTLVFDMQRQSTDEIAIDFAEVQSASLHLDPIHTKYALTHLIENAVAASRAGERVTLSGCNQGADKYILKITDNGCGITEKQLEDAFSPFTQISDPRTRVQAGIGLGLPLARKILSDQGADLKINSTPGKGTTVSICFDRAAGSKAA